MKQIYILSILSLLFTMTSGAQTTFDWENGSTDGVTVQQTVNTITVTFTPNTTVPFFVNGIGFAGSEGFAVATRPNDTGATITFSQPINVQTIFAFEGEINAPDVEWTFTPSGGSNSPVAEIITQGAGVHVNVNWTAVTGFTVVSANGLDQFGFDNIVSDFSLSTQDEDHTTFNVKLFPNPSSDFLNFSNLKQSEPYTIYNVLGSEVLKGTIANKESIDIRNLTKGLYLLNFENGGTLKFIKE